jgi:hypothetical protein
MKPVEVHVEIAYDNGDIVLITASSVNVARVALGLILVGVPVEEIEDEIQVERLRQEKLT